MKMWFAFLETFFVFLYMLTSRVGDDWNICAGMWEIRAKLPPGPGECDPLLPPFTRRAPLSSVFLLPWDAGVSILRLQNT